MCFNINGCTYYSHRSAPDIQTHRHDTHTHTSTKFWVLAAALLITVIPFFQVIVRSIWNDLLLIVQQKLFTHMFCAMFLSLSPSRAAVTVTISSFDAHFSVITVCNNKRFCFRNKNERLIISHRISHFINELEQKGESFPRSSLQMSIYAKHATEEGATSHFPYWTAMTWTFA